MNEAGSPSRKSPGGGLLAFSSGGWVLWLTGLLCLVILVWRGSVILSQLDRRAVGDGLRVETYGFDLSNLTVPRATLIGAGYARDGIPALTDPAKLTVSESSAFHRYLRERHHHKFIIDSDPVIGVNHNGESVAYPTRLLAWHQVVNDTIGGRPTLITYDPLCGSSAVFERTLNGQSPEFGVSGILYNSNLVFYDRRPGHRGESLWCQLQFSAIAGPHAGEALRLVEFSVTPWGVWRARHPDTRVMKLDERRIQVYRNAFAEYFGSDELRFPVRPLAEPPPPRKTLVWSWRTGGDWRHIRLDQLEAQPAQTGGWIVETDGTTLRFERDASGKAVWLESADFSRSTTRPGASPPVIESFWFAWHSQHPDSQPLEY